jgi:hypothetical protein
MEAPQKLVHLKLVMGKNKNVTDLLRANLRVATSED